MEPAFRALIEPVMFTVLAVIEPVPIKLSVPLIMAFPLTLSDETLELAVSVYAEGITRLLNPPDGILPAVIVNVLPLADVPVALPFASRTIVCLPALV